MEAEESDLEVTMPVRLDSLVLAALRPCKADDGVSKDGSSGVAGDSKRQFLLGAWLVASVVAGVAFLLLGLAVASRALGVFGALVTAVPASMALLRGVVDAVSPSGRLPKYTTSNAAWLACYVVMSAGLLFAFVA